MEALLGGRQVDLGGDEKATIAGTGGGEVGCRGKPQQVRAPKTLSDRRHPIPLEKGKGKKVISRNISEMVEAGHPQKQAVAAALRTAGVPKKRKKKRSA